MTAADVEPPAHSFDICSESELFPKKNPVCDEEGLVVPFPTLHGESVEYIGRVTEGVIALSNYRLLIRAKKWFVNIPLGLIDSVDMREIFYILISCKDATTVRCSFATNDWCQKWYKRLLEKTGSPNHLNNVFALSFHAWCMDDNASGSQSSTSQNGSALCHINEDLTHDLFDKEIERMKFDTSNKKVWRMSHFNENFSVSSSYPKLHIVPTSITDEKLMSVAGFRSMKRFPSVVWRSQRNGAVIVRCSQPELGWLGWRNTEDENLLSAIPQACALNPGTENRPESGRTTPDESGKAPSSLTPKKMLLIDCRSYGAAFANRAKGGGCESADYYPCCEIQFMNLANIHSIRKSFIALRTLTSSITDQTNWLSSLENTKWLHYIGAIIRAGNLVVSTIDKESRPVLVHCSDGWDRTPQIVALAQLLLDPYYRKIEGFQALIEREWFQFGHKFADRCGHSLDSDDTNERSPVFLQWLDCVFQIHRQFPCAFEFNEAFLIKLVHHTYSRLFGNFLFNTTRERNKLSKRTTSIWSLLHPDNTKFHNLLYNEMTEQQVLCPEFCMNKLTLWSSVYLSNSSLSINATEDFPVALETGEITPDIESTGLQKTRSCENLAKLQEHTPLVSRRLSDPNILHGSQEQIVATSIETDSSPKINGIDIQNEIEKEIENEIQNGIEIGIEKEAENGIENGNTEQIVESNNNSELNGVNGVTNGFVLNGVNGVNSTDSEDDSESENTITVSESINNHVIESNGIEPTKDDTEEIQCNGHSSLPNGHGSSDAVTNGHDSFDAVTNGNGSFDAVTNGHASLSDVSSEDDQSSLDTNDSSIQPEHRHLHKSVESSTDTITDEEHLERKSENILHNGIPNGHCNGLSNGLTNGHVITDVESSEQNGQTNQYLTKQKLLNLNSTMSTSTSDISDSYVGPMKCNWDHKLTDLKLSSPYFGATPSKLNCAAGNLYSKQNMNSASPSPSSSSPFPTPFSSRTPNSTCPPTPDTATKSCDWGVNRQLNGVGRHLDCDGLTTFVDPIQQRMQQKEAEYQRKIENLTNKLETLTKLVRCNGSQRLDFLEEELNYLEDKEGDHCSLGNTSNPSSDVSWENLDSKEFPLTLWIPDHAVTHCALCQSAFWTAKRKHHCRSCGKVFCADCSNYFSPVPHQLIKDSVRVCRSCHNSLQHQLLTRELIEDQRQPQMVME